VMRHAATHHTNTDKADRVFMGHAAGRFVVLSDLVDMSSNFHSWNGSFAVYRCKIRCG
jgi:hypothetical protein